MMVLGLDGGGTKVFAWLADEDGHLRGQGQGGPVNVNFVTPEVAAASYDAAVAEALHTPSDAVAVVVFGAPTPPDLVQRVVGRWTPRARFVAVRETDLVLAAAGITERGIAVISGTGSIAAGIAPDRVEPVTVGGWGALMGDEGSGFAIGRSALRAVARAADGRGPHTLLLRAVLDWAGVPQPRDLVPIVYHPVDRRRIASLVPVVHRTAEAGDAVASAILANAGVALAAHVTTLARLLGWGPATPFPVVAAGGVLQSVPPVLAALGARVAAEYPKADVQPLAVPPVLGAVRLALRICGCETPETVRRLQDAWARRENTPRP